MLFQRGNMRKIKDFIISRRGLMLFICIVFMIFLRFVFCGFSYAYQGDDYIQYHNYPSSQSYIGLIQQEGLFSSRPLAIILDLYVFAPFWDNMILAVLLISVMYGASAVLFYKVFSRFFGTGIFFVVFYSLLPLCFEGTYWISASSRIVSGLFFTAVSLFALVKFTDGKSAAFAVLFVIFQLLSFSVYEQIFIVSFLICIIFAVIFALQKNRRAYITLASLSNAAIYFVFTSVFGSDGALSKRIDIVSPFTKYFRTTQLEYASRQIGAAFIKGGTLTLVKGFYRGIKLIFSEKNFLYLIIAIALSAALLFLIKRSENISHDITIKPVFTALIALVLAIAPAAAFIFIGNAWFSLRGTVPSMVGAALLSDLILRLIVKNKKTINGCITAAFALIFIIAGVSETYDYHQSYKKDTAAIAALADLSETAGNVRIGIINLNSTHLSEQNYLYHEHITGVTESEWALRGAIIAKTGGEIKPSIVPLDVLNFPFYHGWNESIKRIDGFDRLYFWDEKAEKLYPLYTEKTSDDGENFTYKLYFPSGELCATVTHENGYGYITLSEN